MTDRAFGKPIMAIANSFTQFVPDHVRLRDRGVLVAEGVEGAPKKRSAPPHNA